MIPSLRNWLREAADELLLVEARLPRTLRALFWPSGRLTQEWWEGRRAAYVTPVRLYLLIAIPFFFALAARSSAVDLEEESVLEAILVIMVEGSYLVFQAPRSNPPVAPLPVALREDSAAWEEWRAESNRRQAEDDSLDALIDQRVAVGEGRVFDLLPIAVGITMVPFLALLLGFGSRDRRRFVAHLVFSLHLHTVAYAFIGIGWLFGASPLIGMAGGTVYMGAAFHRITAESIATVVLKCLIVPLGYAVVLFVFYVGMVAGLANLAPGWFFGA